MLTMDSVEEFFTDLLAGQNEESDWAQNEDDGENDPIDDDARPVHFPLDQQ